MATTKKKVKAKQAENSPLTLTLGQIWGSQEVWATLAQIKKSPQIAFKLALYNKNVLNDILTTIDEHRRTLINEHNTSGPDAPAEVNGKVNPEAFEQFVNSFNTYLQTEITIARLDFTLEALVDSITISKDNVVAETTLLGIADFCAESKSVV